MSTLALPFVVVVGLLVCWGVGYWLGRLLAVLWGLVRPRTGCWWCDDRHRGHGELCEACRASLAGFSSWLHR